MSPPRCCGAGKLYIVALRTLVRRSSRAKQSVVCTRSARDNHWHPCDVPGASLVSFPFVPPTQFRELEAPADVPLKKKHADQVMHREDLYRNCTVPWRMVKWLVEMLLLGASCTPDPSKEPTKLCRTRAVRLRVEGLTKSLTRRSDSSGRFNEKLNQEKLPRSLDLGRNS